MTSTVAIRKNKNTKYQTRKKDNEELSVAEFKSSKDSRPVKTKLVIKPGEKWFDSAGLPEPELAPTDSLSTEEDKPLIKDEISSLVSKAEKLLDKEILSYRNESMRGFQKADFMWMDKIMKTGTLQDKMAAFTVRIQDSPIHNLACLQQLIGMIKTQGKQQCLMAADTTRDLFLEDLLPPDRKLIGFDQRGIKLRTASGKQLITWLFEEKLKAQYRNFIECLRRMSSDTIDQVKSKAIAVVFKLLISHPEQEHILLPLLVNKLGDPVKKVASKALFYLNKLLQHHPQMKSIVVSEVERLLFRTNIGKKAQYYGICFLNGIQILGDEATVANKLIKVYLAFFKGCIKTGEIDSKLMSGLLGGVNKAFPVAKMDGYQFAESVDTLYKIVQLSRFNISIQALSLLLHVTDVSNPKQSDRFYRVLYRKLLSPEVSITSRAMQFLNIVYKAMKKDTIHNRIIAFCKRLLQLCTQFPAHMCCATLFLISEVSRTHKDIILFGNPKGKVTPILPEMEDKASNPEELNQSEVPRSSKKKNSKNKSKKAPHVDVENILRSTNIKFDPPKEIIQTENSTEEMKAEGIDDDVVEIKQEVKRTTYDPNARNPAFAGAELSLAFEISCLLKHYHPSVSLFAQAVFNHQLINYDGNPLKDFTVERFLDRFVFRNPKTKRVHQEYIPQGLRNLPVNSRLYLQTEEAKIPIEERFFYKYYKEKTLDNKVKKAKKLDDEVSDVESVEDDEFDEFMDNYFASDKMGADDSKPEDIDFTADLKVPTRKERKRKLEVQEESDDDEAIDFDDEDDEGGDLDADELIDLDEENETEIMDSSEGEDFEEFGGKDFKTKLQLKTKKKTKSKRGDDMFAPAEEFAELLEANADIAFTGSNTLINKDNSNLKQLKWEQDRDRWVKGYKNKTKGKLMKSKRRKFN